MSDGTQNLLDETSIFLLKCTTFKYELLKLLFFKSSEEVSRWSVIMWDRINNRICLQTSVRRKFRLSYNLKIIECLFYIQLYDATYYVEVIYEMYLKFLTQRTI